MVAYLRGRGPVCYTAPLFSDRVVGEGLVGDLLASGLGWCWESERSGGTALSVAAPPVGPPRRAATLLTAGTADSLLEDLRERNEDGYGRFVALLGADPDAASALVTSAGRLREALEAFSQREAGPVRVVVVQIGDTPDDYIFVPHEPLDAVNKILRSWGVDPAMAQTSRPYRELRLASLESLFRLPPPE